MIQYMKFIIVTVGLLFISACSDTTQIQQPESASQLPSELAHFYDYRWSFPENPDQAVTTERVVENLKDFDVVFFGELHNHPAIHLAQMELFAQLYSQGRAVGLSLEQFERDTQPLLDQYLAREIGEEYLAEQARAWKNYRSSYRPLVEFARERKVPVIAANAPKQMVVCVGRSGLGVLDKYPPDQRRYVAEQIDISEGPYRKKFLAFMNKGSPHKSHSHGDAREVMKTMSQRSFAAQMVRDDTMAESIARHLQNDPGRQVLHLNGNFHSSAFLGTVERLKLRMPKLKIAVIHAMTERDRVGVESARSVGTVLIEVLPIPDKFVKAENHNQWLRKMMQKRMESRKNCPE